ncbi:MAG: hypothetical protein PVI40_05930 [Chlamydiota bacterium]|jgi:hypothetical protein
MTQPISTNFSTYIEPFIGDEISAKKLLDILGKFLENQEELSTCCWPLHLEGKEELLFELLCMPLVDEEAAIEENTIFKIHKTAGNLLALERVSKKSENNCRQLKFEFSRPLEERDFFTGLNEEGLKKCMP